MKKLLSSFSIMNILLLTLNLGLGSTIKAQSPIPLLDAAYVASKTSYFTIEEGVISGAGLEEVKQMIDESQFVILGERHGSGQTSILTTAMMPLLKKSGYDNFAVEVGPHSAKKLMKLSADAKNTRKSLYDFYDHYNDKEIDDLPIPFFKGVEDAGFLQAAAEQGIELWGLDQEYYNSTLFLMDELLEMAKGLSNFEAIKEMKTEAYSIVKAWYIKDSNEDNVDLFAEFEKDEKLAAFFAQFDERTPEALQLIEDLKITWDIYTRWRKGSHDDRISYIRNNFMKQFNAKGRSKKDTKVFLKFGAGHCPQIISMGCYDIGHLTNELAAKNGTKCANLKVERRYFEEDGMVKDLMPQSYFLKRLEPFVTQGQKEKWAFIDLESIRNDIEKGKVQLLSSSGDYHSQKELIEGFDFYIVMPVDNYGQPNYKEH